MKTIQTTITDKLILAFPDIVERMINIWATHSEFTDYASSFENNVLTITGK